MARGPGPLIRLTIDGARGIAEFDCEPNGAGMDLIGDNGTGKSSATDALAWALGEDVDGEIVHNGSDGAEVCVKWRTADGQILDIRAAKTRTGKRQIKVKHGKDVKGEPATLLAGERGTVGRRTFSTLPAAQQIAIIKRLAPGLETSAIDAKRAAKYEARHRVGVEERALGEPGEPLPEIGPETIGTERPVVDVVDVAEIAGKKGDAERTRAAHTALREDAKRARQEAIIRGTAVDAAAKDVSAAKEALRLAEQRHKTARLEWDFANAACTRAEQAAAALVDPDTSLIDAEIAAARAANTKAREDAEAHNRGVRARQQQATEIARHNAEVARRKAVKDAKRREWNALDEEIAALDAEKAAAIASAARALPISGIAVTSDGIVTLDDGEHGPVEARVGVLNDAACIELDVHMAAAQGHRLCVIKNAERLGKTARTRIESLAHEHTIQLVREVRTDGAELNCEIIEDGTP